jgi:cysteinyl-tRNA synthetase
MDDDFNTPQAVSIIFDFVNTGNRFFEKTTDPDPGLVKYALDTLNKVGNVLTLFQDEKVVSDDKVLEQLRETASVFVTNVKGKGLEEILDLLLQARETARAKKDWKTADSIRNELDKIGFEVQDTTDGPVWRKK